MKKKLVDFIHSFFRFQFSEKILLTFAKDSFIDSFTAKLVPPNFQYPNPTPRKANRLGYDLELNLNDYNDWKTYWGLKEVEREKLYKLAESAQTIVDVGVNNGWVLMNLAKIAAKNNGHVYGFEPHPQTFKRSNKNISSNDITNATLYNLGCGNTPGEVTMINTVSSNSGQNRIIENTDSHSASKTENVKIVLLDDQLSDAGKIDLIKIDVEGFEKKVLEGAVKILSNDKPVLFIELDDLLLQANHASALELIRFLKEYKYDIVRADNGNTVNETSKLQNCHFDIICT